MPNKFKTLLPPNAIPAERALEQATIEEVISIPDLIRIVKNPALCPVELLPWLAWEFSVDTWNTDWTEAEKRAAIARAAYIHRHRGTRAAIEMSLSSSPFASDVIEWFEKTPRGEPYTFSLEVTQDDRPITLGDVQDLKSAVMKGKNLRSWFDVTFKGNLDGKAILAGYMIASESFSIIPVFEFIGVHINGWMTSEFAPTSSFYGAVYTLVTQGNFGAITWHVTGPATVASDGTVTITGPGAVAITGTDARNRSISHAINPARYFIPTPADIQLSQSEMPAFIEKQGGRMCLVEDLIRWPQAGGTKVREMGHLWGEWGNMTAYGWRKFWMGSTSEEARWVTGSPGSPSSFRRFVRLTSATFGSVSPWDPNDYSTAAVIELEKN
ncbi:phage tail protein I [Serratia sp. CY83965]|uniref:phage tail protein I n=1 Tax=Serratia sp. CY83965 TaxID=3383693 RepID=UPI003FA0F09F